MKKKVFDEVGASLIFEIEVAREEKKDCVVYNTVHIAASDDDPITIHHSAETHWDTECETKPLDYTSFNEDRLPYVIKALELIREWREFVKSQKNLNFLDLPEDLLDSPQEMEPRTNSPKARGRLPKNDEELLRLKKEGHNNPAIGIMFGVTREAVSRRFSKIRAKKIIN